MHEKKYCPDCTVKRFTTGEAEATHPSVAAIRPEFYRLPTKGGDPYFGLTRSWYYAAEREGWLKLVRKRHPGKLRGIVLVPYDAVKRLIEDPRE